jgi:hypothetical protein
LVVYRRRRHIALFVSKKSWPAMLAASAIKIIYLLNRALSEF